jgi:hypothetical protein
MSEHNMSHITCETAPKSKPQSHRHGVPFVPFSFVNLAWKNTIFCSYHLHRQHNGEFLVTLEALFLNTMRNSTKQRQPKATTTKAMRKRGRLSLNSRVVMARGTRLGALLVKREKQKKTKTTNTRQNNNTVPTMSQSHHENIVATALKDAKQAFQDVLDGKEDESISSAAINIDPDDLAASFFAKQQPARLQVKEWIMILQQQQQQQQQQEGTTTKDDDAHDETDDETNQVKQQVLSSQQQVDALYQEYFKQILLNE